MRLAIALFVVLVRKWPTQPPFGIARILRALLVGYSSGLRSEPSCTNGDVTFHRGASSCRRGVGVSSGAHDRALAPCRSRDGMVARSGGMNHLIV